MFRKVFIGLMALGLAGCMGGPTRQEVITSYRATCIASYGHKRNTPELAKCIENLDQNSQNRNFSRQQGVAKTLGNLGRRSPTTTIITQPTWQPSASDFEIYNPFSDSWQ